jgi:large subunit ribosomal protein L10
MSKKVKKMMIDTLARNFADVRECIVIDISTLDSSENFDFRVQMKNTAIKVSGVNTSLARKAFEGSELEPLKEVLKGHSCIASSEADIVALAKSLVDWAKENEKLVIKGGLFEGRSINSDEVISLSKMPSREEILATVVLQALSSGQKIASQVASPASALAGAVESLVKRLEESGA